MIAANEDVHMSDDFIAGPQNSSRVLVRLYESASGWRWITESSVSLCDNGDLDLNVAKIALDIPGECDVSTIELYSIALY